ncbi:MAG: hypothetical protein LQ346_004152, partial [Caloplaca aetnensis]
SSHVPSNIVLLCLLRSVACSPTIAPAILTKVGPEDRRKLSWNSSLAKSGKSLR